MREIKFRAWDHVNMVMENDVNINDGHPVKAGYQAFSIGNTVYHSYPEQYTGLKDKNGKEIYEGDLVKYFQPYSKKTYTHVVKWDIEFASFGLFEEGSQWCEESDWMKIQDLEITGNIHLDT